MKEIDMRCLFYLSCISLNTIQQWSSGRIGERYSNLIVMICANKVFYPRHAKHTLSRFVKTPDGLLYTGSEPRSHKYGNNIYRPYKVFGPWEELRNQRPQGKNCATIF